MNPFPIAGYFCINLKHRKDRYRSFIWQIEKTRERWGRSIEENIRPGVWYESFSQIKDRERLPPLAPYLKEQPEGTQLGTIGCYQSHVRVLEEIAALGSDRWYVVFEDDVGIRSPDWLRVLDDLRLPSGYEAISLVLVDVLGEPLAADRIEAGWFRMSTTHPHYHGLHCYVVLGSRAARRVLDAVARHPYLKDIDGILIGCGESLAWYPKIVDAEWMGTDRVR